MSHRIFSVLLVFLGRRGFYVCLAVMSHTLLVSGCRDQPSVRVNHQQQKVQETVVTNAEWPPDRRRDDQYVGSVRCAECHQDISREYFSSHRWGSQ